MSFPDQVIAALDCMSPLQEAVLMVLILATIVATVLAIGIGIGYIVSQTYKGYNSLLSQAYKDKRNTRRMRRRYSWHDFWANNYWLVKSLQYGVIASVGIFIVISLINGYACYVEVGESI